MSEEIRDPQHEANFPAAQDEITEEELDNVSGGLNFASDRLLNFAITDGTSNTMLGAITDGTISKHSGGVN